MALDNANVFLKTIQAEVDSKLSNDQLTALHRFYERLVAELIGSMNHFEHAEILFYFLPHTPYINTHILSEFVRHACAFFFFLLNEDFFISMTLRETKTLKLSIPLYFKRMNSLQPFYFLTFFICMFPDELTSTRRGVIDFLE